MDLLYISIKLLTSFFGIWFMTRILGKKEITQLTAFDFVSSLMLSELVGNTVYQKDVGLIELLYALLFWTVLSVVMEKLVQAFPFLSKPLNGRPDIIVRDGKIDTLAMKRNNLDFDQLFTLMREQNVFSLREVAVAVFETNGNVSVLKKSSVQSVTREDLQLDEKPVSLPVVLIQDGKMDGNELKKIRRDEEWLISALREQGISAPEEVLYAEWTEQDGLFLQKKQGKSAETL